VNKSGNAMTFGFRRPLRTNDTFDRSFAKVTATPWQWHHAMFVCTREKKSAN
jgi:hypothetical protein